MKRSDAHQFSAHGGVQRSQHAALCWRMHRGHVEVLLITSRDTGRWVIPKGWPMADKTPAETAAQEAWEEAGVRGRTDEDPVGFFAYDKLRAPLDPMPCAVTVFSLRVEKVAAKFPERKERRRKWFAARSAARKVEEPELRALLVAIAEDSGLLQDRADRLDRELGA